MPYDYYDLFVRQRNNRVFTEIPNIVRQNVWRDTFDVVTSQEWEEKNRKIRGN